MSLSKLRIVLKLTCLLLCFTQLGLLLLFYPNSFLQQQEETKGDNSREQMTSPYDDIVLQELCQRARGVLSKCRRNPYSQTVGASFRGSNKLFKNIKLLKSSRQIAVIPDDKLAWCNVPKAASSSIAEAIVEAKNLTSMVTDYAQFQVFLRKFYTRNQLTSVGKEEHHFASFYVTRHPFRRIVSAYKDKLEKADGRDGAYYKMYGREIVKNFRKIKSFHERIPNKEPTFKEFVLYLINTESHNYDLHWQPITILCDVCNFNYNFTIKFENFRSEFRVLVNFLKEGKFFPPEFEIEWKNKGRDARKEDQTTRAYMKQIPSGYVRKLYQIYKADFVYFGYDVNGYM